MLPSLGLTSKSPVAHFKNMATWEDLCRRGEAALGKEGLWSVGFWSLELGP